MKCGVFIKKYWHYLALALLLAAYLFWAYTRFRLYRYQISPDELSYIGIAQKYAVGDYRDAVNGYWGPLISFCVVPILKMGYSALVAMKITTVAWGALALFGVFALARTLGLPKIWTLVATAASTYWLLYFAYYTGTPDIIIVALVLWYLALIYSKAYSSNRWLPFAVGLIGGLLYLAKSYGLLFFVAHFIVYNLTHYLSAKKTERVKIARQVISAVIVLVLILGSWAAILSYKYGRITIGTSSAYNHSLVGPEAKGVHPMYTQGFLSPPNASAISAWEDPSFLTMPKWSAFSSYSNWQHQWALIGSNAKIIYDTFLEFSFFYIFIAILITLSAFSMKSKFRDNISFHLFFTIVVYLSGYLLVLAEPRYLWPLILILLVAAVKVIREWSAESLVLNKITRPLLVFVIVMFVAYWPYRNLELIRNSGNDVHDFFIGFEINNHVVSGKVASSDEWAQSLYLCYYRGSQFYGVPKPGISDAELERQLQEKEIDYYFQWGDMDRAPEFLKHKTVLNKYRNINIIKLK